jgi:hypothetical protein
MSIIVQAGWATSASAVRAIRTRQTSGPCSR